jgi:hypothetical protein
MEDVQLGATDELRASLEELDRQIVRGSLFTQAVVQRSFGRISTAEELLTRLVSVLAERGVVDAEELGLETDGAVDEVEEVEAAISQTIGWPTIALREDDADERRSASTKVVDCDARMHICKAVCCSLSFPLSADEIDAGKVKWDIGHPYIIRHNEAGQCVHNAPGGGCQVYDDRPGVCRRYSCANDARIWTDFDNMVLNQEWIDAHVGKTRLTVESVVPPMEVRVELMRKPRPEGEGP